MFPEARILCTSSLSTPPQAANRKRDKAAATLYGIYNFNTAEGQYRWLVTADDISLDSEYLPAYTDYRKFFVGKKLKLFTRRSLANIR
jgi:hypothetical protein